MLVNSFKKCVKQPVVYCIAAILWAPPMLLTEHYFLAFCIFAYMAFTTFVSSSFLIKLQWKSAYSSAYVDVVSRSVIYCSYIALLQAIAIVVDDAIFSKLMMALSCVITLVLVVVTRSTYATHNQPNASPPHFPSHH
jgi:hypothetical protein